MTVPRWAPPIEASRRERFLLKRLERTKKLFGFLREHRHELFNAAFQDDLARMYRTTGEGKTPVAPALLAMATLLQAYTGASDAEAVELTIVDARWQMVLGVLDSEEPAFSQGALQAFRERLIAHDLDRRLLERTIEIAKETRAFDWKKLPKTIRLAVDSRPLTGAGRVEDTVNLLGHAARELLLAATAVTGRAADEVASEIGAPLLVAKSVKVALDVDWTDASQKASAIRSLVDQIDALIAWVRQHISDPEAHEPLSSALAILAQIRGQDLEPDPSGGSRVRDGVAKDRRISITDPQMRHGRKSKSRAFNGYKSHLAADLDTRLILACALTPANRPESEALFDLALDLLRVADRPIGEAHVDRGYVGAPMITALVENGVELVSKPWPANRASGLFSKRDFAIDLQRKTITCPAGQRQIFALGQTVDFDPARCDACTLRARCTTAAPGSARSVSIAHDEPQQHKLRALVATTEGRERLRTRVAIEHRLAHHAAKQGTRARYRGTRKNVFDARRHAAIINLEVVHAQLAEAA